MADTDQKKLQTAQEGLYKLISEKKTLLLSTLSPDGFPDISYAPYVRDEEGCFYIFISELASHTQNLLHNSKASVMFICDETDTRNLFARERLIYQCSVSEIVRTTDNYEACLEKLETKFGNTVAMLRSLPDFHLFCLKPVKGSYVVGFGKAYEVDLVSGTLLHIDEQTVKQR